MDKKQPAEQWMKTAPILISLLVPLLVACETKLQVPNTSIYPDDDNDGYTTVSDCDDRNREIHPGAAELCDGLDNNCNGQSDEVGCDCPSGQTRPCGSDIGACEPGLETCANGRWGACQGGSGPNAETCDGADNDCDGVTDEGCSCTAGQTRACGTDAGECQAGTNSCVNGSWSATCSGAVGPTAEINDHLDNDCDGATDENNRPPAIQSISDAPDPAQVGQTVTFTCAASDADNDPLTYAWDFGDGASGSGTPATHAYSAAGAYTARCTARDGFGGSASATTSVTVAGQTSCSISITWTAPTTNADGTAPLHPDGTALTDLAGYRVYQRLQGGSYGNFTPAANASFTAGGLTCGSTYCFRVTAIDTTPNESAAAYTGTTNQTPGTQEVCSTANE